MANENREYPERIFAGHLGGGRRIWKPELVDESERAFACEYVRADHIAALEAEVERLRALPGPFAMGDRVEKIKGSCWRGRVVGFYSTALTSIGYAVESENEPGSVQVYPAAALRAREALKETS